MNSTSSRAGGLLHGPIASASAIDGNIYCLLLFFSILVFPFQSILIILRSTFLRSRAITFIFLLPAALMMQGSVLAQTNTFPTTGNVGIGTNSPVNKLEVRGGWIYTDGSLQVDGGDVYISRTNFSYGYVCRPNAAGSKNLQFAVVGGGPLDNLALNSNITFTSGKLGINNNIPVAQLDVYFPGTASLQQGLLLHSGSFVNGANAQASYFIKAQDDGNGAAQFIVHGDGSTGISTDAVPGYKLSVNGPGIFTKLVVKQNIWSDYVFDSSYRLTPLKEVESYIRGNHHLPEVPSADSVEKNGIDVGGNQAVLLKKVEELTLYLIEQGQKLDEQNKLLKDQRAVSKALEERLVRLEKLREKARKNRTSPAINTIK